MHKISILCCIFANTISLSLFIMKKTISSCIIAMTVTGICSGSQPWLDPEVNAINRAPMHTHHFAFESAEAAKNDRSLSNNYLSLNGTWQFHWVQDITDAPKGEFWKADGADLTWGEMPVPGMWQLNGYGDPIYLNIGYAWLVMQKTRHPFPHRNTTMLALTDATSLFRPNGMASKLWLTSVPYLRACHYG